MELEYWIWLQCILGYANRRFPKILERFSSPREIYETDYATLCASRLFTKSELGRIEETPIERARQILARCREEGCEVVTYADAGYPEAFRVLADPPVLFYRKGSLSDLSSEVILSIVGPRRPSEYGQKAAFTIASRLASGGFSIANGGARGVDAQALMGALSVSGKAVAVLGCGIAYDYLKDLASMRQNILADGCLLSEYPPDYPPSKLTFPLRNRLVAALSQAVIVVEASAHSGTLITAHSALDQGKDLYVIPGMPGLKQYAGSNRLLLDGARPLLDTVELFTEYAPRFPFKLDLQAAEGPLPDLQEAPATSPAKQQAAEDLSENAKALYDSIQSQTFLLEALAAAQNLTAAQLLVAATELEMRGLIRAVPGGRYALSESD